MRILQTDCTPEEVQQDMPELQRLNAEAMETELMWDNHTRKRTQVSGNGRIDMQEYFEFLEDLRDSGSMNMMGAPRELQSAFGLDRAEAREVFSKWCESLKDDF
jgi:hypothetical protein